MNKFFLFVVLLTSTLCKSKTTSPSFSDAHYNYFEDIIDELESLSNEGYYMIFTINTSFCGSCTDKNIAYIQNPIFNNYLKTYITDVHEGSIIDKINIIPNSNKMIISIHEQERAGIFSTYNKIYIIHNKKIIYTNYLIDDNLKAITKFIKSL